MWCLIVFRAYWFWWFSSVCGLSFLLVWFGCCGSCLLGVLGCAFVVGGC